MKKDSAPWWIQDGTLRDEHRVIFARYRDAPYLIEWGLGPEHLRRLCGASIVFRSGHVEFVYDAPFFLPTQKIVEAARSLLRDHPHFAADAVWDSTKSIGDVDASLLLSDATFVDRPGTFAGHASGFLAFRDFGQISGLWRDLIDHQREERGKFAALIQRAGHVFEPLASHGFD